MGHVRPLIGIEDPEEQYLIAQKIFDERLTVRETEKLIKKLQQQKNQPEKEEAPEQNMKFIYENLEEQMKQILGTKVSIHPKKNNKGKIEIEYYSQEELDHLLEMMQTIHKD